MKPHERVKEIEKLQVPSGNPTCRFFSDADKKWLITRIKNLTRTLDATRNALEAVGMKAMASSIKKEIEDEG